MNLTIDNRIILKRIAAKLERAHMSVGRLPYDASGLLVKRNDEQREQFIAYLLKSYGDAVSIAILKSKANAN